MMESVIMPTQAKVIFTIVSTVVAGAFLLIDPKADNAGPNWIWRLGKHDPIRTLLCRPNGSLRKSTKPVFIVVWLLWLAVLWCIVPSI